MDYNKALDLLKQYMGVRIPLLSACMFGYHKSPYFPSLILPTTIWKSQIPSFEEFKEACGDVRYDWRRKKHIT